jgi:hypothetical protein
MNGATGMALGSVGGGWVCKSGLGGRAPPAANTAAGMDWMSDSRCCIRSSNVAVRLVPSVSQRSATQPDTHFDLCGCVLFPGSSNVHAELAVRQA